MDQDQLAEEPAPPAPWFPTVELVPSNSEGCALSAKISVIPKYAQARAGMPHHQPAPRPATNDLALQEVMVMEDLLYVLTGNEGSYIRFADTYEPTMQSDRLKGPEFRIAKFFDPSIKDLSMSMVDTAKWYMALEAFTECQSSSVHGRVNQALCASIRAQLKDYIDLVSDMERQMLEDPLFTLHNMSVQLMATSEILHQAYGVAQAILAANLRKTEEAASAANNIDSIIERIREARPYEYDSPVRSSEPHICKGGSILRLLAERLENYSGDPVARSVLLQFLHDASIPYLAMFEQWIHRGVIDDPYSEFLVKEAKNISKEQLHRDLSDQYWDRRYTVRKDDLPLQLSSPDVYEKVLLAGKYLNVIRECGGADVSTDTSANFDSIEDSMLIVNLAAAYTHANESLLRLLIDTHGLHERLSSLKHYFFLDRADFFISFLDIAESELNKPSRQVSITKLQYLLDMALRQPGSISAEDPFKDEVIVNLSHTSLTEYLLKITNVIGIDTDEVRSSGGDYVGDMILAAKRTAPTPREDESKAKNFTAIMGLQLDFKIPFPLSLALSRNSIMRYQFLFRHLVELKNIERSLNLSWADQIKSPVWRHGSQLPRLQQWKQKVVRLRTRMLLFIQQLLFFCTVDVIEPNWTRLETALRESKTVDQLMKSHIAYLDTCIKECMLTSPRLLKIQAKLFRACRMFGTFIPQQVHAMVQIDPTAVSSLDRGSYTRVTNSAGDDYTPEELMDFLDKSLMQFLNGFDRYMRDFVEEINYSGASYSSVLLTLTARVEVCMGADRPSVLTS